MKNSISLNWEHWFLKNQFITFFYSVGLTIIFLLLCTYDSYGQGYGPPNPNTESGRRELNRQAMGYEASRREHERQSADSDDSGLILMGIVLFGAAAYVSGQQSGYTSTQPQQSKYYNRRYNRRFVPRPPAFILAGSIPLYKSRINEHWKGGLSGEIKAEFLVIGNRGRYPNFGLYANAAYSAYRYNLPFSDRQYYLGHEFVNRGVPNAIYPINRQVPEEEKTSKTIGLSEKSVNLGVSLKTFFKGGVFLDVGAGYKLNRKVTLEFAEDFVYLTNGHRINNYSFKEVADVSHQPYLFNYKDTYVDFGIGKIFQGKNTPIHIKLAGKLFQMDLAKTAGKDLFFRENEQIVPVDLAAPKLGYSISFEMAWIFGRFTR